MVKVNQDRCIIVANGSECKILLLAKSSKSIKLLKGFYSTDAHLHAVDLGNRKPGIVHESINATRHAIEAKSDLHYKEKVKFSNLIASHLNEEIKIESFSHLILIASPEFLGEIRKRLNKGARSVIKKEINQDLTHVKDDKIMELLWRE